MYFSAFIIEIIVNYMVNIFVSSLNCIFLRLILWHYLEHFGNRFQPRLFYSVQQLQMCMFACGTAVMS